MKNTLQKLSGLLLCLFLSEILLASAFAQESVPQGRTGRKTAAEIFEERSRNRAKTEQSETVDPLAYLSEYEKSDQSLPKEEILSAPDRSALRPMEQAKQLIERERVQDAVQRLSAVLEGKDDFFLEPEEKKDRLTQQSLKHSAEELFLSLSEEGRRLYTMQYEPLARRLLENAVEAGSLEQIEHIVERYFFTEPGQEAAFLLAMHQFDRGARGSALLLLRKIASAAPSLDPYEPNFSLTLAACEKTLGEDEAAKKTLEDFLRRHPNPRIREAAGTFWTPKNVEEILAKLDPKSYEPDIANWLEHSGWLLPTGTSNQDSQVRASVPLLELLWKLRVLVNPKFTGTLHVIEGQMRVSDSTFIPAPRPIVVGETVIYRSSEGLVAVNARTGKRIWIGKEPQYEMPTIGATLFNRGVNISFNGMYGQNDSAITATLLRMRLWHNNALGTISSDGRLVYSIENEPSPMEQAMAFRQGAVFLRQGKQIEDPRNRISTTLVARDVKTGEIVWKTGKAVLVQKLIDQLEQDVREEHKKNQRNAQPRRAGIGGNNPVPRPPGGNAVVPPPAKATIAQPVVAEVDINGTVIDPETILLGGNVQPVQKLPEVKKEDDKEEAEEKEVTEEKPVERPAEVAGKDAALNFGQIGAVAFQLTPEEEEKPNEEEKPEAEAGIEVTDDDRFLGDTYFLGPPLPVQGKLYVLGENSGVVRLFVFEAGSGRLLRHFAIATPTTPIETDWLRRFRGPVPAYSEGILVCPTAAGALAAFDLSSGKPLWCYVYSDKTEEPENQRGFARAGLRGFGMIINQYGQFPFNFAGSSDDFQYLRDYTGWSSPTTMISDGKIIFAPADRTMLYCFDLLSGKLLWKRSKGKARYVACVHENKVVIVAVNSVLALDLATGAPLWNDMALSPLPPKNPNSIYSGYNPNNINPVDASKSLSRKTVSNLPEVKFEKGLTPSGIGLRNGKDYMIPMSDRSVCVVDLDTGRILKSTASLDQTPLGNLVALGGKIFSLSATELNCFNQIDSLRLWAEQSLQKNPNDPEALVQLGRLAWAEDQRDEALELFKKANAQDSNLKTRSVLRRTYTELFRTDFAKYRTSLEEIEKLADGPDSIASLVLAYANGCVQEKDDSQFMSALERLLDIDRDSKGLRSLNDSEELLLSRWIGNQVRKLSDNAALSASLEQLAQNEFDRVSDFKADDLSANQLSRMKRRQWSRFIDCFGSFPIADQAREELYRLYDRDKRSSELEFFINPVTKSALPGLEESDGEVKTKPMRFAGTQDWQSPNQSEQVRAIYHLAQIMEESGQYADALHYYRMLSQCFAEAEVNEPEAAKQTARELYLEKLTQPKFAALLHEKHWPEGKVEFELEESTQNPSVFGDFSNTPFANFNYNFNHFSAFNDIPLLWNNASFFKGDRFLLNQTMEKSPKLLCLDYAGRKKWTATLPEFTQDARSQGGMIQYIRQQGYHVSPMGYFKSHNHILYFASGLNLIAIDTLKKNVDGEATVLWKRKLQSSPGPVRVFNGAMNLSESLSLGFAQTRMQYCDPIFVNAKSLCIHDLDAIYGLDPLSGEVLWKRDSCAFTSFLTGDDQYLYQIRSAKSAESKTNTAATLPGIPSPAVPGNRETLEAVQIDSRSGEEISVRAIPATALAVYGTKVAYLKSLSQNLQVEIFDLSNMSDPESIRRELALSTDPKLLESNRVGGGPGVALVKPLYTSDAFPRTSLVGFFEQGRVIGVLSQTRQLNAENRLVLIDLAQGREVFSSLSLPQQPVPENLNAAQARNFNQQRNFFQDFYIELDGKEVFAILINQHYPQNVATNRQNNTVQVNRNAFNGVPLQQIGLGMAMRYDNQGKALWEKPAEINNWFMIPSPFPFPVTLFGAMCFENRNNGQQTTSYPVFWGLDKKTGARRFSNRVDNGKDINRAHNFSFFHFVDPEHNRIEILSNQWKLTATFQEPAETPEGEKETAEPPVKDAASKLFKTLGEALSRQIKDNTEFEIDAGEFWDDGGW